MKLIPTTDLIAPVLVQFATACGGSLARAHARSGDPAAIDAYMGKGDAFTKAMRTFARRYADQNERDHAHPVNNSGGMQAFAFNIRRAKFQDPRVRRAFNYAFDFEEMNKQIFFGQYTRIASYFAGTELAATGLPQGRELEILQTVRDKVPSEGFRRPTPTRSAAAPRPCAKICARRCGF